MAFAIHIISLLRRKNRKQANNGNWEKPKQTFSIELAGLVIRITSRYENTSKFCKDYLVSDEREPDITAEATDEDIQRELEKCKGMLFGRGDAELVAVYEQISNALPAFDALVMHSSVVAVNGEAYCFAAESGTGKSTHTRYWKEALGDRVTVINGDKPIYRFDGDQLMAYGTPWCGKEHWQTKTSAPLKALCLLERGEENAIFPVDANEVLNELIRHFHLPGGGQVDTAKLMELINRMVTTVPLYRLRARNDISAAKTAITYFEL